LQNAQKDVRTYDSNNNVLTQTLYSGSGSTWTEYRRYSNQYDANNNQTQYTIYNWVSGAWKEQYRYVFTYNASNLMTQRIFQTYTTGWVNSSTNIYTYNAAGSKLTDITQYWRAGAWDNATQLLQTYNTDNFLITEKTQGWDGTTWNDSTLSTYTRNTNNQRTYILSQKKVSGSWEAYKEAYYYYENYTTATGINDIPQVSNIKAYPNPFTVNTAIAFEMQQAGNLTISIYDIAGALIKQEKAYYPAGSHQWLWDGNSVSGTNVSAGIYFVALQSNGLQQTQKLIKTQ
jgi:hypothetical protein